MGIIPKKKIFGADIAGRVEAAGKNVKRFRSGDEVFGDISGCGFGGFAEYAAVPENVLAKKPDGISFETAAGVPMASVTALQALRKGGIQPGQKVLIYGAGGGVGTFAIQLAGYFGAEASAVCGPKNAELVRSLGAARVIDYTKDNFKEERAKYDLILAVNGENPLRTYKNALAPKGACIIVGGALSQVIKGMIFGSLLSVGGQKIEVLKAKPDPEDLEFIISLVEEGRIRPVIDRRYPLRDAAEAMRYLGGGHGQGKVVLEVAVV
jgi:NADPH:quinone reductase-like Zn-dependent oxidoreductase